MRINIYAEEITDRIEIVAATAENTGAKFIGVRFYLESSDKMYPPKHPDDDSSAVTFWAKSGKQGYKPGDERMLEKLFHDAAFMIEAAAR